MDKVFNLRKAKNNSNSLKMNSQPTKRINLFNSASASSQPSTRKFQKTNSSRFDKSITNFYHIKRRVNSNNGSFEESPVKSPFKKCKSSILEDNNALPITWGDKINISVDCQLKVSFESNQQKDTSLSFKNTETNLDQVLDQIKKQLHLTLLPKHDKKGKKKNELINIELIKKENDEDKFKDKKENSGNDGDKFKEKEKRQDSGNEFDDFFNDDESWLKDNAFKELEKQLAIGKELITNESKESGISSCNSLELNKQNLALNKPEKTNSQKYKNIKLFKIPETPVKESNKLNPTTNSLIQFVSTPKVISRQPNRLNQGLNFEGISPIKGNGIDNSLVNIKSENKRSLNDSVNQDNSSCKKRNGRILFQSNEKPNNQINKPENFDLIDDSFDLILSQVDDKALVTERTPFIKKSNTQMLNNQQQKSQRCCSSTNNNQFNHRKPQLKSTGSFFSTQPVQNKFKNSINSNYSKSQQPLNTPISSQFSRSTKSSIQFTDDSSNLFLKESYNQDSNQKNRLNNKNIENDKNDSNDVYFNDEDEDADFICSQVVC